MSKLFTTSIIFVITFFAFFKIYSQELVCGNSESIQLGTIPVNTQGQGKFFRVLIIYITFKDDVIGGPNPPVNIWQPPEGNPPQPTKPMNYYHSDGRMVDTAKADTSISYMNRYSEYTYSDYFCEMSR